MESHLILITTRDSLHATQRHSNILERTFLMAADHANRPRIHVMTKIYPKGPLFARWDKLCTRISPDRGNLLFMSPVTFSITQMSYEDDVHRQLRAIIYSRPIFRHFRVDWFEMLIPRNPVSIYNICIPSSFIKLSFGSNWDRSKYFDLGKHYIMLHYIT